VTVELEKVQFTYPRSAAGVHDIDLTIREGELIVVIGDSGSGKTTLLKLIAGFERPGGGTIRIGSREVQDLPPARRNLGVVFQTYALFPLMSVSENVGYPLRVRGVRGGERRKKVMEMLDLVGLRSFADRYPGSLSGGQQQRVALARALVFNPHALLLDEPLSALDATLRVNMRDEIRRLQKRDGITTIHVTHDQEEALSMADRVAVLKGGKILQIDTPRNLYDRPVSAEVAGFVGRSNLLEATVIDGAHVETAFGAMRCGPHAIPPGSRVTVMVRPEKIRIADRADGENSFPCRVLRERFLGPVRRLDLAVRDVVLEAEASIGGPVNAVTIPPDAVTPLMKTATSA
jgi:putative spermidine/putrescine transport system ATP-binding protein